MVLDHPWMSLDHHSSPKIPETAQSSTSGVSTPRLCGSTRTDYKLGDERVPGNISPKSFAKSDIQFSTVRHIIVMQQILTLLCGLHEVPGVAMDNYPSSYKTK